MKKFSPADLKDKISRILIKYGMSTRQAAINEIIALTQEMPCCGHNCCCNKNA